MPPKVTSPMVRNRVGKRGTSPNGVGSRAGYYETTGALRDMLQNHLLQLLAIAAMEPPVSSDANAIRNEMLKVFLSLQRITTEQVPEYVVRGQYTSSTIRGVAQKAYRDEKGVDPASKTETFVAMKCFIDNCINSIKPVEYPNKAPAIDIAMPILSAVSTSAA